VVGAGSTASAKRAFRRGVPTHSKVSMVSSGKTVSGLS
jgi:hypothetical protein